MPTKNKLGEKASINTDGNAGGAYVPFKSSTALLINFVTMAFCFAANHGTVTALIAVGSSLGSVSENVNGYQNGALYVCYTLSALLFANAVVTSIGPKWTIFAGLAAYCTYVASFVLGSQLAKGSMGQVVVMVGAGVISGCGAGVLWTGQGKFFASTADQYAALTGMSKETATTMLSTVFTVFYLGIEVLLKFVMVFVDPVHSAATLFTIFAIIALGSTVGLAFVRPVNDPAEWKAKEAKTPMTAKLFAAVSLCWTDPKALLMAPYNFTFGFAAPFLNQYINSGITVQLLGRCQYNKKGPMGSLPYNNVSTGNVVGFYDPLFDDAFSDANCHEGIANGCPKFVEVWNKSFAPAGNWTYACPGNATDKGMVPACSKCVFTPDRDAHYLGYMTSALVASAVVTSLVFGQINQRGLLPKWVPMVFGSLCFMTLGFVFVNNSEHDIAQWKYVIPLYLVFGVGRGVWESTTRGVFADFFPGEKATAGFANIVWQNGLPGAFGFFAFPHMGKTEKAMLLLCTGALGIVTYLVANNIAKKEQAAAAAKETSPLLDDDALLDDESGN